MTDHEPTQPIPNLDRAAAVPGATPASRKPRWWRRTWVIASCTFVLGLILGSPGEAPQEGAAAASSATPTATATATVTETAPAPAPATVTETAPPAPAKTVMPEPAEEPKPRGQAANSGSTTRGRTFVLPDATGQNLQVAQDNAQEASGDPLFVSFSEDATGADRAQILDSGWVVCSQKPVSGTEVKRSAFVTYFVVRAGEDCP